MNASYKTRVVKGFFFRILVALLAAHLVVSFGEQEHFFELLLMPEYYPALASSFLMAFLLLCAVDLVNSWLDNHYDWQERPLARAILQLALCLVLAAVVAFLLAAAYFQVNGYNILETPYLRYDFPVIVLLLILLNTYYIAAYLYRQWKQAQPVMPPSQPLARPLKKEVFIVHRGQKAIPLPVENIACVYREGDNNFLKTFDGETFHVPRTLDEIETTLGTYLFFRANRQWLVHHGACLNYAIMEFGKLELFLSITTKQPVIISQKKARAFKEWLAR